VAVPVNSKSFRNRVLRWTAPDFNYPRPTFPTIVKDNPIVASMRDLGERFGATIRIGRFCSWRFISASFDSPESDIRHFDEPHET